MTQVNNESPQLQAIEEFESQTGYDATYLKEMLEHSPEALDVFNAFIPMAGFRKRAPLEVYYTAKLAAYRYCDCGPCFQLALFYAKQEGVSLAIREHIASGKGDLPPHLDKVKRFAIATLSHTPELETLRQPLENEYGKAVMIELGLAIAAPQIFPVVKRAMGHYKSCSLVNIEP